MTARLAHSSRSGPSARWPRPTLRRSGCAPASAAPCSGCRSRSRTTSTSAASRRHTAAQGAITPATADSEVVRRLRAAGAVVLGKTALCELAAWGHFTASEAFGTTRNPWNLDRSPGGSSGGSAAAVAAGLVPIALGSDGGGSIRIPAAFCGLFGLKPQRGRVPLAPLADHWHGCTVLGGLGRSVLDVALFDDAIRGPMPGRMQPDHPSPRSRSRRRRGASPRRFASPSR